MSLVINAECEPVHHPKRRDVFEFDEEIAEIFENMALRSIPLYAEMHRIHARLAAEHIRRRRRGSHILVDVGASTGVFYKMLAREMGYDVTGDQWALRNVRCLAVDTSLPMLGKIQEHLPFVEVRHMAGHEIYENMESECPGGADIVCMHYLLQFVPISFKEQTLRAAFKLLRKNGMLFLGQKDAVTDVGHKMVSDVMNDTYIDFRLDNGYSPSEIAAKTRALRGSMWCSSRHSLQNMLFRIGFTKVVETTRWCQFSSMVAIKS